MARPSNELPKVPYWQDEIKMHLIWDPQFDPDRILLGKPEHNYPDFIVHALEYERNALLGEKTNFRSKVANLSVRLKIANKEIEHLKAQIKEDQRCMQVGKKRCKEAWDILDGRERLSEALIGSASQSNVGQGCQGFDGDGSDMDPLEDPANPVDRVDPVDAADPDTGPF